MKQLLLGNEVVVKMGVNKKETLNETSAIAECYHIWSGWKVKWDKNEVFAKWNEAVSVTTWNETDVMNEWNVADQDIAWWKSVLCDVSGSYQLALRPMHIPPWPFTIVSMDMISGLPPSGEQGYTAILVIVDKLTKFTIIIPTHTTLSQEGFAKLFMKWLTCMASWKP